MKHNTAILTLSLLLLVGGFVFNKSHHKVAHPKKSIAHFHPDPTNAQLNTLRNGTPGRSRVSANLQP